MFAVAGSVPSWGAILFASLLSGLASALGLLLVVRPRRAAFVVVGAVAAVLAPLAWLAMVRVAQADGLAARADVAAAPVSWLAAGAGVWTFAAVAAALGFGPDRRAASQRVLTLALGCGLAAFGVVVYLT